MLKLSAVIITLNEEKNIGRCIDSLKNVADEIVVIDSFSTDRTKEICLGKKVRFIDNKFDGHIEQKNFALSQAVYPFVLSLDADEALSLELEKSILEIKANTLFDAYSMNRLTNYCGQWIRHGGWYPDTKIRLWNKEKGQWGGVNPHDKVILQKNVTVHHLKGDLLHYSFYTKQQHIEQIIKFNQIGARALFKKGVKSSLFKLIFNPTARFLKMYILKLGFLDGVFGFFISYKSAWGNYLKYKMLRDLWRKV